ncbi:hypothetical protein VTH06DRAFT_4925 [Thermothelomyces fergusii]
MASLDSDTCPKKFPLPTSLHITLKQCQNVLPTPPSVGRGDPRRGGRGRHHDASSPRDRRCPLPLSLPYRRRLQDVLNLVLVHVHKHERRNAAYMALSGFYDRGTIRVTESLSSMWRPAPRKAGGQQ